MQQWEYILVNHYNEEELDKTLAIYGNAGFELIHFQKQAYFFFWNHWTLLFKRPKQQ